MKTKMIEKLVSLASAAEQSGKLAIAKKLDKMAETMITKAEMEMTIKSAAPTKEQKIEQMHNAINVMLAALANAFKAKYKTEIGLPKEMVAATTRKLKNSELASFMKTLGFEYKTWNQMWNELGRFNVKFNKVLNTSRHPFVIGPEFMGVAAAKPTVEIGEPEFVNKTPATQPAPTSTIRPEDGEIQELPEFQTSPVLPEQDWTRRKL
mgnify:CR=1 FL=1